MSEVIPLLPENTVSASTFCDLPSNIEAEKAFLGCLLVYPDMLSRVPFLKPDHFACAENARIFEACLRLKMKGKVADYVTLKDYVTGPEFGDLDGPAYLLDLAHSAVGQINGAEYARLVFEAWQRRTLIEIGQNIISRARRAELETTPADLWAEAETRAFEAVAEEKALKDPGTLAYLEEIYRNPGKLLGVPTGFVALDRLLSGFQPGQLILLAGRPSMGKTTLAVSSARKGGAKAAFLSLEQAPREIEIKIISDLSNVSLGTMRRGDYRDVDQFTRVVNAGNRLREMPLRIAGRSGMSPQEIRAAARRIKKKHGLDVLYIDQLTHIRPPDDRTLNRVHQIGEILKALKALAQELEIPIVLLHQLSRAVEGRDNKRPTLADLRDSGEIEQDADVVMFVYREDYYLDRSEPEEPNPEDYATGTTDRDYEEAVKRRLKWEREKRRSSNLAEVIVAKQRMGPIDTAHLFFDGRYSRFADITREPL